MLRVRVSAANMGGFSRNWQNIVKHCLFSAKIHDKSGYDGKFR